MLQDGLLTHIPAQPEGSLAASAGPPITVRPPGPHQPAWDGKAASSFAAVADETQIPPEPEAYVNVWF